MTPSTPAQSWEEQIPSLLENGNDQGTRAYEIRQEQVIKDVIKLISTTVIPQAKEAERKRITDWLEKNDALETKELGKIVLWGWIYEVVNPLTPDQLEKEEHDGR